MEFLQPVLLWGIGAIGIPIAIHFWHQKRGKPMAWAATRWLQEKNQQPQRGAKLDKVLLLIIRCLLLIALAVLLSRPVVTWFAKSAAVPKIHLVQPEKRVVDNFRFELEEAIKKGETVYWVNSATELVKKTDQLPEERFFNPIQLQSSINKVIGNRSELHLYLMNNQQLATVPFIRVPARYKLHTVSDSSSKPNRNYLELTATKKVFVNQFNQLANRPVLESPGRFQTVPVHTGSLTVFVNYQNKLEEKTVLAALNALSEVYALDLVIDFRANPARKYDWILTDQEVHKPLPEILYVVSGKLKIPIRSNVIYTEEKLSPKTAEIARNGQLPEWLGELLIRHFKLNPSSMSLTQEQLNALFIPVNQMDQKQPERIRNWILLAFVCLVGAERWMALTKNA
ncbi:BatA domain-containing protein [Larkinella rosea]|uniref:Aerotolerance regulator N-terminal domain-containing protein n=1 Tax=Larkinella rosea TaxID=2025312 RepID=A0A3P1BMB4_9BACT|nr:BatA domain-containing protein [Larkinella rosea]RRB02168.1 hypothetical protein EHT25_16935 [Larkinella rosea]